MYVVMVSETSRHHKVVSGSHTSGCGAFLINFCCCPVCHDHTLEAPFITCGLCTEIIIIRCMNTVDQVIACHDRQWLRFSDCDFKSFKVYFAECTLGNHTVRSHTVVFLVVTCEMLDSCATSIVGLYTFCHCCCDGSCHIRIFRIIFEVSSTERISVNVHSRCQPECHTEIFHLCTDHRTNFTDQCTVPCLCKQGPYRNRGTVLIVSLARKFSGIIVEKAAFQTEFKRHGHNASIVHVVVFHETKSRRTVCQYDTCQAFVDCTAVCFTCGSRNRNTCRTEVSALCFARISSCQIDQLFFCQCVDKIQRIFFTEFTVFLIFDDFCRKICRIQLRNVQLLFCCQFLRFFFAG